VSRRTYNFANLIPPGTWEYFFARKPEGYTADDIHSARFDSCKKCYGKMADVITVANHPILSRQIQEVSDSLGLTKLPLFLTADGNSQGAYSHSSSGVPYGFIDKRSVILAEVSEIYNSLIPCLLAHEIWHGNQIGIFSLLNHVYGSGRPRYYKIEGERVREYFKSTPSIMSTGLSDALVEAAPGILALDNRNCHGRLFFGKKLEEEAEFDADMAWPRVTGDFRSAMQEIAYYELFELQTQLSRPRTAARLQRAFKKGLSESEEYYSFSSVGYSPTKLTSLARLGIEEKKADKVPRGESPVSNESDAYLWAENFMRKVFNKVTNDARQVVRRQ
jgi:hypothetical protein